MTTIQIPEGTKPSGPEGRPLLDATKALSFQVLPDDVKRGIPRDPNRCALARAALRTIDGDDYRPVLLAAIGARCAHIVFQDLPEVAFRFMLSADDAARVRLFDKNVEDHRDLSRWMAPDGLTVTLQPPSPAQKLRARKPKRRSTKPGNATGGVPTSRRAAYRHL